MILNIFLGALAMLSIYYYMCSDNYFTTHRNRRLHKPQQSRNTHKITQSSREQIPQTRPLHLHRDRHGITQSSRKQIIQTGAVSKESYQLSIEKWEAQKRDPLDEINLKKRVQEYHPITSSSVCYYKETRCLYEKIFSNFIVSKKYIEVVQKKVETVKVHGSCCKKKYIYHIKKVSIMTIQYDHPHRCIYFAKYFQLNPMKYVKIPNVAWVYDDYEHVLYDDYEHKTLKDVIYGKKCTYLKIRNYAKHLLLAIDALHKRQIIMGNLSPGTIIIDSNDNVKVKDFSLAVKLDAGYNLSYGRVVPLDIASPEYLSGINSPRKQNDWWAYGIVLYYMYMDKYPFKSENRGLLEDSKLLLENIKTHNPPMMSESIPSYAKDLIEKLLKYNRNERIIKEDCNMNEILKHPYFIGSGLREELKKDFYFYWQ